MPKTPDPNTPTPTAEEIKAAIEGAQPPKEGAFPTSFPATTTEEGKPLTDAEKMAQERQKEVEEIHKKMQAILDEYGGLESNIPASGSHDYWVLQAQLRAIKKY